MGNRSIAARAAVFGLCLVLFCSVAAAQYRAGIQGTVVDTTGAVVPGVKVTLTSEETGLTQDTVSGDQGFYRFAQLAPGTYTVAAEAAGFKRAVKERIQVQAEQVEGIDVVLAPGEVTETVTVSAENETILETERAAVEDTITTEEIRRLPQIGRDPYELVRLAPGVFGAGARTGSGGASSLPGQSGPGGSSQSIFQTENQVPISANGQRVSANNYEIDGVSVNSQTWGGAAVITPNQESVKEIRVASSQYSAETGRNTGAVVQVVSQNGTNALHGSFVFKLNDPELNAYNRWGGPFRESPLRVENNQKQYAASLGGPIIPNRLFWFFSYETARTSNQNPSFGWVETPQLVSLIGSARPNSIASSITGFPGMTQNVVQTLDRSCAEAGFLAGQCQTVNGGLDIGSPTGGLGQLVNNRIGGGFDNIPDVQYVERVSPSENTAQQFNGRVDFQATESNLFAFSMYYVPNDNRFLSGNRPSQDFLSARRNMSGALLWTRTLSPTSINEARFNVTRWYFDEIESNPDLPWGIPEVTINDIVPATSLQWGVGGAGVFYQTTYNFRDVFSQVINTHSLRFGVDINREQNNDTVAWAARPTFRFNNLWSFLNDVPTDESGNYDPRNGFPTDVKKYIRTGIYALFVQDDWKVRPNLTVNLGLRWEYFTPNKEKFDNISNFIPGEGENFISGGRFDIGGYQWEPDRNNFAPQVGFAWSPNRIAGYELNNRTVLRGGFGVGYNRIPMAVTLNTRLNPPFFSGFNLTGENVRYRVGDDLQSFYGWSNNPATILQFDPTTNIPLSGAAPNVFSTPRNLPQPYTFRYSFDIQQDIGGAWVATLGYQGSQGRKFSRTLNYSLIFPGTERLGAVEQMRNDVNSNFNALLARIERRFASGFQLAGQYRWSKAMDFCSHEFCNQTYPFDQSQEYGPADFDVTHYFVGSALWELPFYRTGTGWARTFLGGWQLNGIVTAHSGFPWTPVWNENCPTLTGRRAVCPVRPIGYLGGAGDRTSNEAFQGNNGNFPGGGRAFFVPPPTGTIGAPALPGIGRNVFRGPRYFNTDISAGKRFYLPPMAVLGENANLDLRMNFFNIFNQLNLQPFGYNSPSTQANAAGFGMAERALAGRIAEFQLRFEF